MKYKNFKPSPLELVEDIMLLRALENDMKVFSYKIFWKIVNLLILYEIAILQGLRWNWKNLYFELVTFPQFCNNITLNKWAYPFLYG